MARQVNQGPRRPAAKGVVNRQANAIRRRANEEFVRDDYDDYDYELSVKVANRGCLLAIAAGVVVLALVLLIFFIYVNGEISGNNASAEGLVTVDVPTGSGYQTIGALLEEGGLIGSESVFGLYVQFNGTGAAFQAGRHEITAGMGYDEILQVLITAPPPRETMRVTFPEGITVIRFATICEENGLCTAEEFLEAANNGDYSDIEFFSRLNITPDTFMRAEGYLAPNTYDFYVDEEPENIVRTLFEQFDSQLTEDMYIRMEELGLNLTELMALASLVEEEAGLPDENQAMVAGVFLNRLNGDLSGSGLARRTLGSDVTYYYLRDWVARDYGGEYDAIPDELIYAYLCLDEEGLRDGLPTGPISNPSWTAVQASLYPEQHDYFYFLTDFYGEYYYAETYAGHLNNIATMEQRNAQWEREQEASSEG